MLNELKNVIKTVRLKHLVSALLDPSHALEAFKYHYRRVSEKKFAEFFAGELGKDAGELRSAYSGLRSHDEVWSGLCRGLSSTPGSYGPQMLEDGPLLYLLIRLLKPEIVVETGIAAGISSCFILQAIKDNCKGRLYSIELAPSIEPYGKKTGWLVPDGLRSNWELSVGDSRQVLGPLLGKLHKIDCFIHDSLHTYDHMLWELNTAWKHLKPKGILLAHDVGENRAFFDFMREKNVPWGKYRVHGLLGGFRAP